MLPGRSRRHRAAAELAERRLEGLDPGAERGVHVGEALAAGVVEVGGQLDPGEALARGGEELAHLARVGHPGRVAEGDLLAAGAGEALGDLEHPLGRHLALVGAAERGRDHALAAKALGTGALDHPLEPGERLGDRAVDVRRLWVSEAERKRFTSSKRSRWASARSSPRSFGIRTEYETPSTPLDLRPAPARRRRAAAITSGRTNEVTSIRRSPVAREHPDQPHLLRRRDHLRLVLKPVAGPDLADPNAPRQLAHRPEVRRRATQRENLADVIGLEAHLRVGEAQRGQAARRVGLVADAVPRLRGGGPVVAQAIGLDDQPEIRPVEVHLEAIDPYCPDNGVASPAARRPGRKRRSSSESVSTNVRRSRSSRSDPDPGLPATPLQCRTQRFSGRPGRACPPRSPPPPVDRRSRRTARSIRVRTGLVTGIPR